MSATIKPTVRQVEEALGVKAEDWDCVDPEELIETIYNLSIADDIPSIPKPTNVHPLREPKVPGNENH